MNILVTAGNTQVPLDRVRCITNLFSGRTGARLALHAHNRGHDVTLLTSHPEVIADMRSHEDLSTNWHVQIYRTFEDLQRSMETLIREGGQDAILHTAAVSDYLTAGIYAPGPYTHFLDQEQRWQTTDGALPTLLNRSAGKIKSDEPELWVRLVRGPKLVDYVRSAWGFHGILVKFKLEVDVTEKQLLEVAEPSRLHSAAELIVANTLEEAASWAYLGPIAGQYQRLPRQELAPRLLDAVENLYKERTHG